MRTACFALILLAAVLGSGPSLAGTLWQGATSGMSPRDLKSLYPTVSGPAAVGGNEMLVLRNVVIFDEKFAASFFFKDGGLFKVRLLESDPQDKAAFRARPPAATFGLIRDDLVAKYGQPVSSTTTGISTELFFVHDGTSIELSYIDKSLQDSGDRSQSIAVTYEPVGLGTNPL
jgi:hypothetical protein